MDFDEIGAWKSPENKENLLAGSQNNKKHVSCQFATANTFTVWN